MCHCLLYKMTSAPLQDRMQRIEALWIVYDRLLQEIHDDSPPTLDAFMGLSPTDRDVWCQKRIRLHRAMLYTLCQLDALTRDAPAAH